MFSGRAPVRSRPPTRTRPAVGRTRPEIVPSKVDFPAPLAPISATSSPLPTCRSTPKSTGPAPKPAVSPCTSSSGVSSAALGLSAGISLSPGSLDDALVLEYLRRIALRQNLAEMQHQRSPADADDDAHHVLDEDDRDAGRMNRSNHVKRLVNLDGVEPGHHFVEQQEPRSGRERAGDLQALAVGDGEGRHRQGGLGRQPDDLEDLV